MSPVAIINQSAPQAAPSKSLATISTPLPNPSLVVTADHKLKLEEAPVYAPARGEVLLHIKATGVCG
jgi:L-iditol 2-dehydrogenase